MCTHHLVCNGQPWLFSSQLPAWRARGQFSQSLPLQEKLETQIAKGETCQSSRRYKGQKKQIWKRGSQFASLVLNCNHQRNSNSFVGEPRAGLSLRPSLSLKKKKKKIIVREPASPFSGSSLIKITKVLLAIKAVACFLLFCYFWESCHLKSRWGQAWFFSQTLGNWHVGEGRRWEKCPQLEAKVKVVHVHQHEAVRRQWRQTQGTPPVPFSSQLDFPGHLIQSETVRVSSILQPIKHAGNKTPDSVPPPPTPPPASEESVASKVSSLELPPWKKTPSTQYKQLLFLLTFTGRTLESGQASMTQESLPFSHKKPPFHSARARRGIYRNQSNESLPQTHKLSPNNIPIS